MTVAHRAKEMRADNSEKSSTVSEERQRRDKTNL